MTTATITTKGQITIPKDIRDSMNLKTGDRVNFFMDDNGRVFIMPATRDITSLKGIIQKPAKPVSLEDMDSTIRRRGSEPG